MVLLGPVQVRAVLDPMVCARAPAQFNPGLEIGRVGPIYMAGGGSGRVPQGSGGVLRTLGKPFAMNMVYNSSNYCIVQFSDFGEDGQHPAGGFEIMDKGLRREIFLDGKRAEQFRDDVARLISDETTPDDFDAFLESYTGLMTQPVTLH